MILIQGKGVSNGVAIGPLYFYQRAKATITRYEVENPDAEWARFKDAQGKAIEQLGELAEKAREEAGDEAALLFETHQMMAYNKDLQEDKPPVFDAGDTLKDSLNIFTEMISTMEVRTENMEHAAKYGYMNATDAADYLVGKGIPFRDCHEIIGKIVLYCIGKGIAIEDLTMEEFKGFSNKFDEDIYEAISIRNCIKAKKSEGSTSFESVAKQLEQVKKELK